MKHIKLFEDIELKKRPVGENREKITIDKQTVEDIVFEDIEHPEYELVHEEFSYSKKGGNINEIVFRRKSDGKFFKSDYWYSEWEGAEFYEQFKEVFRKTVQKYIYV